MLADPTSTIFDPMSRMRKTNLLSHPGYRFRPKLASGVDRDLASSRTANSKIQNRGVTRKENPMQDDEKVLECPRPESQGDGDPGPSDQHEKQEEVGPEIPVALIFPTCPACKADPLLLRMKEYNLGAFHCVIFFCRACRTAISTQAVFPRAVPGGASPRGKSDLWTPGS